MRVADIDPARLKRLNAGAAETTTLVECLAVDFVTLLEAVFPEVGTAAIERARAERSAGISRRMALMGQLLAETFTHGKLEQLQSHPSDTVRGWACFATTARPGWPLGRYLEALRPLADDPHFGVREWAWLAVRPHIANDLDTALSELVAWTDSPSERLRRFASEATRPRGVWCAHIPALKAKPALGLPIVEPLQADTSRYVQDSVGNWLNDAAKSDPVWVRALCDRWTAQSDRPSTHRICKRATRSIKSRDS